MAGSVGDVQMSLFRAVYGTAGERPPYADAGYYGEITHPAPNLSEFMAKVAVRLGGGDRGDIVPAQWRLAQAMGGGKSHGLIGLWHLASHPEEFRRTDIGKEVFGEADMVASAPLPRDLNNPVTVVLSCDNMTPGKGDAEYDGPATSLYERFLWRLFEGDKALFKRYQPHHGNKAKISEALVAVDRPVLILVDEVLDYVRQLSDSEHADLAVRDMSFLRALFDAVDDVPNCALVVVLIASEDDATDLDAVGQSRRTEIEDLLIRNALPATVTSNTDFGDILRRRLFKRTASAEVVSATSRKYLSTQRGHWQERVFDHMPRCRASAFEAQVARCYPFHPSLMQIAEEEWSLVTGFQKVRSTIRIFAAAAFVLAERGRAGDWSPLLIGPGDLPLSESVLREAVIGSGLISDRRTESNYRSLAATDIVGDDDASDHARAIDLARDPALWTDANPRAAERAATAMFLYSIVGGRAQGQKRGATEVELKAASFVPDASYSVADAEIVLAELADVDRGLATREVIAGAGGQPSRWFLTTRHTLNMHYRAARTTIGDDERDDEFAAVAERLANTGPFTAKKFVHALSDKDDPTPTRDMLAAAGLDDARSTRLAVLDPRRFSFLNGIDADTRQSLRSALGVGDEPLPVEWAAALVFAVVNTQRRGQARAAVADYIAWKRVCGIDEVAADEDVLAEAKEKRNAARRRMEDTVKAAYQHIAYLDEGEGGGREMREARFEPDNQTALDGTVVWAKLIEEGRALGTGQFDATALLHNLRDDDYGRPLNEVRDLFWNTPRMPLLPQGEPDLKRAIFDAVARGRLRIVGADGQERAVTDANAVGLGQASLRLARPAAAEDTEEYDAAGEDDQTDGRGGSTGASAGGSDRPGTRTVGTDGEQPDPSARQEVQVAFTLNTSLTDDDKRDQVWKALDKLAAAVDEGQVSHIQVTVRAVVESSRAERVVAAADEAGAHATRTAM